MTQYTFYQKADLEKYFKYVPVMHKTEVRPLDEFNNKMDGTVGSEQALTKHVAQYKLPGCYYIVNSISARVKEKQETIDRLTAEVESEKRLREKLSANGTASFKELFEIIINH